MTRYCDACGNPEEDGYPIRRAIVSVSYVAQWSGLEEDGEAEQLRCPDCDDVYEWLDEPTDQRDLDGSMGEADAHDRAGDR